VSKIFQKEGKKKKSFFKKEKKKKKRRKKKKKKNCQRPPLPTEVAKNDASGTTGFISLRSINTPKMASFGGIKTCVDSQ